MGEVWQSIGGEIVQKTSNDSQNAEIMITLPTIRKK